MILENETVTELISAAIGFIGIVAGWGLNELSTCFRERTKLCFQMVSTQDDVLTEREHRVKESPSEYGIEIFNVGKKPFVLESFSIFRKKRLLVVCQMPDNNRIVLPFRSVVYVLTEQEADAMEFHCQEEHFEKCKVIAYSVDHKKIKETLLVPILAIQADIRNMEIV